MKKLWILVIMTLFLLVGCGKSSDEGIVVKEDATLLMANVISEDEGIKEFYAKAPGKEEIKIASNVRDHVIYFNEFYFFVDSDKSLQMVSKDGTKEKIASNIASPYYDDTLGNLKSESSFFLTGYDVSNDCKSIVYVNDDYELYYYRDGESEKIASDIHGFVLSDIGDNIYYIDNNSNLYLYKEGEKEKISSDVNEIKITPSGNTVAWTNSEYELYMKSLKDSDKQKIYSDTVSIQSLNMLDEESILYLGDFYNLTGELYIYSRGENKKIASDVSGFKVDKNNNKIYYLNEELELYEVELKNFDNKNKISSSEGITSLDVNNGKLYYIDEDSNLFCKDSGKESIKVGNDLEYVGAYKIINGNLVYATSDKSIYLNDDKIVSEAKGYAFNSACIVYVDQADKVHVYDVNSKTDSVEIENCKKYSSLHLGSVYFYECLLEPSDIEGYWKTSSYTYEINPDYETLVKFSGNNMYIYAVYEGENASDEYTYTVYNSTSSTMNIETDYGMHQLFITLSSDGKSMTIEENGDTTYLERISEEEFNGII